ncbi:MAG: PIN domain-containing protein [Burkholderiaceae bacterium]
MSDAVFLDSGIFIALMSKRDRWHPHAAALFGGPKVRWWTSMLVVAETYSWFLHRMGEEPARTYRSLLANMSGLTILDATAAHHAQVESMLDRFRGAKLSYVDASSLYFIDRKKIKHVWSTDHHLGLTGAEILPRS